jgi:SnoaL-like domain
MTADDLIEMEQIKRLKYRYFRALDTNDSGLLGTLLTEGVTARFIGGSYDVAVEGRSQLLEFLAASASTDRVMNHNGHHPEIDVTGPGTAEGLWYLSDWTYSFAQKRVTRGSAVYRDRYVKESGAWKISHTGYERVFEIVEDHVPPMNFTANLLGQGRST